MTAVHLEAKVDLIAVDLARREHLKPDYLALNPNGKVPVLNDDGFVLWESHAIMQYLADKTPGQTVYPQEARARADVNRWLFWSAHHFQPAASVLNWEHNVKAMIGLGAPDPAAVKRGEELIVPLAAVLDAAPGRPHLGGAGQGDARRLRARDAADVDGPGQAAREGPPEPDALVRARAGARRVEEDEPVAGRSPRPRAATRATLPRGRNRARAASPGRRVSTGVAAPVRA